MKNAAYAALSHDPLCRQQHWDGGDCFDCRLIAKVRADERHVGLHITANLLEEYRDGLRAKVEWLRAQWQAYLDADPTQIERQLAWSRVDTLQGVLALIDGPPDPRPGPPMGGE